MSQNSHIEWTDATWNPVTGCTKVSPGCKYCYAERIANRLQKMGQKRYINAFELTLHEDLVDLPLKWRKPRFVFVNSMSDLFHEEIPIEFIKRIFQTMEAASHHIFQILTKRAERLAGLAPQLAWPSNVWMGVSIENEDYLYRIKYLQKVPAAVRFLSIEPLLGPIRRLPLGGIDWVIVGGESGPKARPVKVEWVRNIRDSCLQKGVPFFLKQWGGKNKKATGRSLDCHTWDQMPLQKRGQQKHETTATFEPVQLQI